MAPPSDQSVSTER